MKNTLNRSFWMFRCTSVSSFKNTGKPKQVNLSDEMKRKTLLFFVYFVSFLCSQLFPFFRSSYFVVTSFDWNFSYFSFIFFNIIFIFFWSFLTFSFLWIYFLIFSTFACIWQIYRLHCLFWQPNFLIFSKVFIHFSFAFHDFCLVSFLSLFFLRVTSPRSYFAATENRVRKKENKWKWEKLH